MNKRRMNKLIAALKTEAAKKMFDMRSYIKLGKKPPREAFKSKGDCGTAACIAGMAAIIAPKFFNIDNFGIIKGNPPYFLEAMDAFADWLDIPKDDAFQITEPKETVWVKHKYKDITHAINVLEAYRDGGMDLVGKIEGVEL